MESAAEFIFDPLPPIEEPAAHAPAGEPATSAAAPASAADPLGPLAGLKGTWTGRGFNVIWRPRQRPGLPKQDHFLELNRTSEQLDFGPSLEKIPNRGLLQHAISLHGLNYLQQISDENLTTETHDSKQHFEPGLWVIVPETSQPQEPQTVARLACIPHGTTFLAQGTAHTSPGAPSIPDVSIRPFPIGEPRNKKDFLEQHLEATGDRSPACRRSGPQRRHGARHRHVLGGDFGGKGVPRTPHAAVLTACAAELRRLQLASRHGRHAPQDPTSISSSHCWSRLKG